MNRKFIFGLLVVLLALMAGVIAAQDDEVVVEAGEEVKLGLAVTLSGDAAPFGVDIQRGVELAIEDRPFVVVDGVEFPVTIDPQDEGCNAETGQAVANRFTSDASIVAVIGHMCSSSCTAAAPIYDSAGYSMVTPSCTAPSLTQRGFTSFNRAVVSDAVQGPAVANFIYNELGVTTIATIHDGSAYGEGLVSVVAPFFEELGGTVVAQDAVNVGDTDFRALLEEIAAAEPELVYFVGFPAEGALLARQVREISGLEDVIFMGADGIDGPGFIELAGDASEGVYTSVSVPFTSDALDEFFERYVEAYEEEPPGPYNVNGYDAYNLLLNAIEETASLDDEGNLVISRAAISEYLRSFEGYEGLTGLLTADGTGETSSLDVAIKQVIDGENVELMIMTTMDEDMEDMDMEMEATEEAEG